MYENKEGRLLLTENNLKQFEQIAALKWWNSLSEDEKIWEMIKSGYEKRHPNTLSESEIKDLWLTE